MTGIIWPDATVKGISADYEAVTLSSQKPTAKHAKYVAMAI